jgi:parallel beta-helix repeat protein
MNLGTKSAVAVLTVAVVAVAGLARLGGAYQTVPPGLVAACEPRTPIDHLPFPITRRGSYVLVHDLGSTGGDGITIAADNVTVDLDGFSLDGRNVGSNGITTSGGSRTNVRVLNGHLLHWQNFGANLSNVSDGLVENLTLLENGNVPSPGIGGGLSMGSSCVTRDCVFTSDTQVSVVVGACCILEDCTVSAGAGVGIRLAALGSVVRHCSVWRCADDGIQSDSASDCAIVDNLVSENWNGIHLRVGGNSNRVEGNQIVNSGGPGAAGIGVQVDGPYSAVVMRNSARGNVGGNYSIASGNDVGPIGSAASSTSPFANVSY